MRPIEFDKLLSGKPHSLSKDEVDKMLTSSSGKYCILPKESLLEEISCRIDSWILDVAGRRDFQHTFNVNLRRYLHKSKLQWERLSVERQREIKYEVTNLILQQKREELLSLERTSASISKDLYWQFEESLKDRAETFPNWLAEHLKKFKRTVETFRTKAEENAKSLVKETVNKHAVAGINDLELRLKKVGYFQVDKV